MKEIIEWIDASKATPNRTGWFLVYGREYGDARIDNKVVEIAIAHYINSQWFADLSLSYCRECDPALLVVAYWAELPKGPTPTPEPIPYETNS